MSKGLVEELLRQVVGNQETQESGDVDTLKELSSLRSFMKDYHMTDEQLSPGDLVVFKDERFANTTMPKPHEPVMIVEMFEPVRSVADGSAYSAEPWDFRFVGVKDPVDGYLMFCGNSHRFRKYEPEIDGPFEEDRDQMGISDEPVETIHDPYGEFEPRD